MESTTTPTGKTRRRDERDLWMVLELELREGCPLREVQGEVHDAELHVHDSGCHCDFTLGGEDGVEHQSVEVEDIDECPCACRVFTDYGCVPHLRETGAETTLIATYVPDREVAWQLVEGLGTVCDTVRLVRLTNQQVGEGLGGVVDVHLSDLSEKQREALDRAVKAGYYQAGNDVSLEDLAAEFDISPSALSQRLARAEETVMSQLFDR
ncbi:MAG: helix-turn-helix domain-containing protein [Halodesulfurarchaeum sp.]